MLRFSNRYFSHSFELISAKLYEDIDNHGGIEAVTFLGDLPIQYIVIKNLLGL